MNKNTFLIIVFCFFLLLFLLLFSYQTTLYLTDLTPTQQKTLDFLQEKKTLPLNYTTLETSHLEDVKKIMLDVNYLFYFLLLILTLMILYYWKNKMQLQKMFLYGGIITLVAVGLLLLGALISFNTSFTLFHQIFFPQGNWQFPADSLLIQTFPGEFFVKISQIIFLQTFFYGSLFILLALYFRYGFPHPRA